MNPAPPIPSLSEADIDAIRACGRTERNAGYVACLVGVVVMLAGRFMVGVPAYLVAVGVAVVVFGWGLLAFSIFKRVSLARTFSSRASG